MIGIYCIEHIKSNKKYIGKSKQTSQRFNNHRYLLSKSEKPKDCNRHLYNAVQKYGWESFEIYLLETFEILDENVLRERELYWIDYYKTCDRKNGYNLRRDSSTGTLTSAETLKLQSKIHSGKNNANYGNKWSELQKKNMSENAIRRHKEGIGYNKEWKNKISIAATKMWKDEDKKLQMAKNVSKAKEKYNFLQYKNGWLIKIWNSIKDIVKENPEYKWQNIYAVCNGYKPTYRGFVWKKKLKNFI